MILIGKKLKAFIFAKAHDFDNDGDLDFAVIAHFADYKKAPKNSFIYLENANLKLAPFNIKNIPKGKWLTMEKGDYDNDGDEDIFLGSFILPNRMNMKEYNEGPPVVILKNQFR